MSTKHPGEVTEFYQKYPIADKNDAEHHEHDPVAKAAFILAVVAIAAAGPLVNDTIRQKVVRATAKEVAICNGETLYAVPETSSRIRLKYSSDWRARINASRLLSPT